MNKNINYLIIKRFFDIVFALILLIILSPIIIISSVILFFDLNENPFFIQLRPGFRERLFYLIKLKTMRTPKDETQIKSLNQRVTKFSRIVRKLRIDEFPQLINIIIGHMSFVGPRPLLKRYLNLYTPRQRIRHSVLPGIAGFAQIKGSENLDFHIRIDYDIEYVRKRSFLFDLSIIIRTLFYVLKDFYNKEDHDKLPEFK